MRGLELSGSAIEWREASESVRRMYLLSDGSCERSDRQACIAISSAV